MAKKEKKPVEPQYYRSATNLPAYNYKVYHMKPLEKALYFLAAFVVGAAVGYLFYGGIGVDEFGNPTTLTWILNFFFCGAAGFAAGFAFVPMRRKSIIAKRQRMLKNQFRDMLEAISTSISAGNNVTDAFRSAYEDLKIQYDEGAFILKELEIILSGMNNNVDLVDLLQDFGARSGCEDIMSFANVFKVCYEKGGNIKDTLRTTHEILSDKMEIAEDIETIVTSNKVEQNIMIVMPIALIGMIKLLSAEFAANFTTPTGILASTIAIVMFAAAYKIGQIVLAIKI